MFGYPYQSIKPLRFTMDFKKEDQLYFAKEQACFHLLCHTICDLKSSEGSYNTTVLRVQDVYRLGALEWNVVIGEAIEYCINLISHSQGKAVSRGAN